MAIHVDTFSRAGGYQIDTRPLTEGQVLLLQAIKAGVITVDDLTAEQHAALAFALPGLAESKRYDPNERRDSHGRWARGAGLLPADVARTATPAPVRPEKPRWVYTPDGRTVQARGPQPDLGDTYDPSTEMADLWIGVPGKYDYQDVEMLRATARIVMGQGAWPTDKQPDNYYPKDDSQPGVDPGVVFESVKHLLVDRLPHAEREPEPLYRGLTGVDPGRFTVGATFSEGLASWTPDAATATDFAGGKYTYHRPGTEQQSTPGVIMRVRGLPSVKAAQESTSTDPLVLTGDERIASGRYRVVSSTVQPDGHTLVDVEWEALPYDPAEAAAVNYEPVEYRQMDGTIKHTMGITRHGVSAMATFLEQRYQDAQHKDARDPQFAGLGARMALDLLDEPLGSEAKFDPDQPRDAHGRWARTAGSGLPSLEDAARAAEGFRRARPRPYRIKVPKPAVDAAGWAGPKDQGAAYVPTAPDSGTWPRRLVQAYEDMLDDPDPDPMQVSTATLLTCAAYANQFAEENGLTPDEQDMFSDAILKRALTERMQNAQPLDPSLRRRYLNNVDDLRAGAVMVAVPATAVGIFNDPEKRFKTQFETYQSGGAMNHRVRAISETAQFNHAITLPPEKRTVYGYMAPEEAETTPSVTQYGNMRFKLKPHMRDRTTMTIGDSLSTGAIPIPVTGEVTDEQKIRARALRAWLADDAGVQLANTNTQDFATRNYAEAQIHGGVSLDDVEAIYVSGSTVKVWSYRNEYHRHGIEITWEDYFKQFAPVLQEKGIKVFNNVRTGPYSDSPIVAVPIDLGAPA